MNSAILTIDPGVRTMGYVLWHANGEHWRENLEKKPAEIYKANENELFKGDRQVWNKQIAELMVWLEKETVDYKLKEVICEMPKFFIGPAGDAAARRGDLTHMAFCVGSVGQFAKQRDAKFFPVEVDKWKGQLPKLVVCQRIINRLPSAYSKLSSRRGHDWDAAGLGLYCQKLL